MSLADERRYEHKTHMKGIEIEHSRPVSPSSRTALHRASASLGEWGVVQHFRCISWKVRRLLTGSAGSTQLLSIDQDEPQP